MAAAAFPAAAFASRGAGADEWPQESAPSLPEGGSSDVGAILVGGRNGTGAAEFASLIVPALAHALGNRSTFALHEDGEQDGVTAANQFDAGTETEQAQALIVPGAAVIAALAGDQRVHFDYGRWVASLVAQVPVVTVTRGDLHRTLRDRIASAFHDKPVRIGVSRPAGAELPSVLGLSLLGLHSVPVSGFGTPDQAIAALKSGELDAIQLTPGPDADIQTLLSRLPGGTAALFAFGAADATIAPDFASVYTSHRNRPPSGPLFEAWNCVAAAASIDAALVLPMLTAPATIARWRHAAALAISNPGLRDWASRSGIALHAGDNSASALASLNPSFAASLTLRRWLALNAARWRLGQETRAI